MPPPSQSPPTSASPLVGQRIRRKEDRRLLTGRGRFIGDINLKGTAHIAVLRSVYAHAQIRDIDVEGAFDINGVLAVYTAADLDDDVGPFVEAARSDIDPRLQQRIAPVVKSCPMRVLAGDRVMWVGQPVAIVVAENRYLAEDALERIVVDYEELPTVLDPEAALAPDSYVLHTQLEDNVHSHFTVETGDVQTALAGANHRLSERITLGRQVANPIETRGVVATYEAGTDQLTVWCTNARPHLIRTFISKMLGITAEQIRVVGPDMGGSFGTGIFQEDIFVPYLALKLGRPVQWIEDRRENLLSTRHGRDQIHEVDVGFDSAGTILALKDRYVVDCGAYNPYAITMAYNTAAHMRNQFRIEHYLSECLAVLTNKAPVTPVRGAGLPESTFVMDRVADLVARHLDLDPVEVRRRNLIPAEEMPYRVGIPHRDGHEIKLDVCDYPAQLESALDLFGYESWRALQQSARGERSHLRIGIGVSSYVEGSGLGPYEGAIVRIDQTGHVNVMTGAKPHGQGLETTLAQVTADQLNVGINDVTVKSGDTALIPYGVGTFASRGAAVSGSAVAIAARQLREKVLVVAGEILEANPSDLEISNGKVVVRGASDKFATLQEVAAAAAPGPSSLSPEGFEPGLEARHYFVPETVTFGSGTHVCAVEVDEMTGFVRVLDYATVDDCGHMLNPMIVEGQLHGGIAHGLGNALLEEAVYDDQGQLLTTTYMDYLLPTSADMPTMRIGHQEFPSELNPLGVKGVGEGGTVSSPGAIANAVVDALWPMRVSVTRIPVRPETLLTAIRAAQQSAEEKGA